MEKFKKIKEASILGIIGNAFLFVIKMIAGSFTNSKAMIVDAINSLTDIISSVMTFIGNRIASKPIDEDHNLGHGKAEYIYSLIISLIMFALTIKLLYDSAKSLIVEENYMYSPVLIAVCILTIAIKLALYIKTVKIAREYDNLLIKANAIDHRNDCLITGFNLFAAVMSSRGIYFIDGLVGIGIASWLFYSALDIFKKSYNVLMDKAISSERQQEVLDIIKTHKEVLKINHFNSTPIGYQYQISFTIFVDGSLSTYESHAIADTLEEEIGEKIPEIYLTVVHVNPMTIENNKQTDKKTKKGSNV